MPHLKRLNVRPDTEALTPTETRYLEEHYTEFAGEVLVDNKPILWDQIDGVEVVKAPRASGLVGLFVRHVIHGDERFHVGIYYTNYEAVLPNVTLSTARYIIQSIAFYAPGPVAYRGLEGLSPLAES